MRNEKNDNKWPAFLALGGIGVCCTGHVLALFGGLTVLSGVVANLGGPVVLSLSVLGLGFWFYKHQQKKNRTHISGTNNVDNAVAK